VVVKGGKKIKEKTFEVKVPVQKVTDLRQHQEEGGEEGEATRGSGHQARGCERPQQKPVYDVKKSSMCDAPLRYRTFHDLLDAMKKFVRVFVYISSVLIV
jgi:hypothetical protein